MLIPSFPYVYLTILSQVCVCGIGLRCVRAIILPSALMLSLQRLGKLLPPPHAVPGPVLGSEMLGRPGSCMVEREGQDARKESQGSCLCLGGQVGILSFSKALCWALPPG